MNLTDNGGEFAGKKTGMTYTLNVRFFLAAGQHYMDFIINEHLSPFYFSKSKTSERHVNRDFQN